jgi:hypothetical protein
MRKKRNELKDEKERNETRTTKAVEEEGEKETGGGASRLCTRL